MERHYILRMIRRFLIALILSLPPSAAALAGDGPRLASGGIDVTADLLHPERRLPVFASSGFSVGGVVQPGSEGTREGLAVGGYASYTDKAVNLSSSLRREAGMLSADVTAAYDTGIDSVAAVSLGYDRLRPSGFSVNPATAGLAGIDSAAADDLSLSLTWRQSLTPNLSLGGFAAAIRSEDGGDEETARIFRLGAGLGYKF